MTNPGERARHVVVLMGASANLADLAREMNMDGYLNLPFSFEDVDAAMANAQRAARAKRARPPIM